MKINIRELKNQYVRVLKRTCFTKLTEMLEIQQGRAKAVGEVYETVETIYKLLEEEVRDKELTNEDFPLSAGTGGLRLTLCQDPLLMELSIEICDSQVYDDEEDSLPNCPFTREQMDFIRDLFGEALIGSKEASSAEAEQLHEMELEIINVCQRKLGCDQFLSLEQFYNNKSNTWTEII